VTEPLRIVVDGGPIAYEPGDSVAIAILRAGQSPGRGGTLCLAGDCGNCVAEVDGVAWVRTCQVAARPGLTVIRQPADGLPALPLVGGPDLTVPPIEPEIGVERVDVDVAVIGGGTRGRSAATVAKRRGRSVVVLDAGSGDEVVAVYAGSTIVVRSGIGMRHVRAS